MVRWAQLTGIERKTSHFIPIGLGPIYTSQRGCFFLARAEGPCFDCALGKVVSVQHKSKSHCECVSTLGVKKPFRRKKEGSGQSLTFVQLKFGQIVMVWNHTFLFLCQRATGKGKNITPVSFGWMDIFRPTRRGGGGEGGGIGESTWTKRDFCGMWKKKTLRISRFLHFSLSTRAIEYVPFFLVYYSSQKKEPAAESTVHTGQDLAAAWKAGSTVFDAADSAVWRRPTLTAPAQRGLTWQFMGTTDSASSAEYWWKHGGVVNKLKNRYPKRKVTCWLLAVPGPPFKAFTGEFERETWRPWLNCRLSPTLFGKRPSMGLPSETAMHSLAASSWYTGECTVIMVVGDGRRH